jgi:hypothetical protein
VFSCGVVASSKAKRDPANRYEWPCLRSCTQANSPDYDLGAKGSVLGLHGTASGLSTLKASIQANPQSQGSSGALLTKNYGQSGDCFRAGEERYWSRAGESSCPDQDSGVRLIQVPSVSKGSAWIFTVCLYHIQYAMLLKA